jgi:hypothetical protein
MHIIQFCNHKHINKRKFRPNRSNFCSFDIRLFIEREHIPKWSFLWNLRSYQDLPNNLLPVIFFCSKNVEKEDPVYHYFSFNIFGLAWDILCHVIIHNNKGTGKNLYKRVISIISRDRTTDIIFHSIFIKFIWMISTRCSQNYYFYLNSQ